MFRIKLKKKYKGCYEITNAIKRYRGNDKIGEPEPILIVYSEKTGYRKTNFVFEIESLRIFGSLKKCKSEIEHIVNKNAGECDDYLIIENESKN